MNTPLRYRLLQGTAVILFVAGVAYSCKDFLNTPPQGSLLGASLQTKAGVEGTLLAAYRALDCTTSTNGNWGCAASNWVWGSVASDDAYKGSNASDQPPINDIEAYVWSTGDAESYLNVKWAQSYEGVVRANATLSLLKQVLTAKPAEIGATDAQGIRGEAMFLRAHYHFEAWRMWGNIPYYTETDSSFRKTNQGVNAPALISQDLDSAIAYLPATPRGGQAGRVTSWTAKAYKGRLQVYTGNYAAGLTTLRDVQARGPYRLQGDFSQVWTGFASFANGPETILAYEASANDGEPNGNNGNYGERLNFPYGLGFCCGFHQPSQNLVNFFVVNDSGLPLALTSATWNASNANLAANTTIPVDPRLDWTVGRDGVPYKDWGLHNPKFIRDIAYSGPYSPKKNVHESKSGAQSKVGWLPKQLNSVHIHIYRYADLLLLLAEAEVEAGVPENARAIVNQIRTRAGVVAQGCGSGSSDSLTYTTYPVCRGDDRLTVALLTSVPKDSLVEPWAFYKIGRYTTPWSQAFARGAVRFERRLELAMEGQRFFDLRRYPQGGATAADSAIPAYLAVEKTRRPGLVAAVWQTRNHLYPIPNIQIKLSTVGTTTPLVQNTGW
jgi:hypothetical protein